MILTRGVESVQNVLAVEGSLIYRFPWSFHVKLKVPPTSEVFLLIYVISKLHLKEIEQIKHRQRIQQSHRVEQVRKLSEFSKISRLNNVN